MASPMDLDQPDGTNKSRTPRADARKVQAFFDAQRHAEMEFQHKQEAERNAFRLQQDQARQCFLTQYQSGTEPNAAKQRSLLPSQLQASVPGSASSRNDMTKTMGDGRPNRERPIAAKAALRRTISKPATTADKAKAPVSRALNKTRIDVDLTMSDSEEGVSPTQTGSSGCMATKTMAMQTMAAAAIQSMAATTSNGSLSSTHGLSQAARPSRPPKTPPNSSRSTDEARYLAGFIADARMASMSPSGTVEHTNTAKSIPAQASPRRGRKGPLLPDARTEISISQFREQQIDRSKILSPQRSTLARNSLLRDLQCKEQSGDFSKNILQNGRSNGLAHELRGIMDRPATERESISRTESGWLSPSAMRTPEHKAGPILATDVLRTLKWQRQPIASLPPYEDVFGPTAPKQSPASSTLLPVIEADPGIYAGNQQGMAEVTRALSAHSTLDTERPQEPAGDNARNKRGFSAMTCDACGQAHGSLRVIECHHVLCPKCLQKMEMLAAVLEGTKDPSCRACSKDCEIHNELGNGSVRKRVLQTNLLPEPRHAAGDQAFGEDRSKLESNFDRKTSLLGTLKSNKTGMQAQAPETPNSTASRGIRQELEDISSPTSQPSVLGEPPSTPMHLPSNTSSPTQHSSPATPTPTLIGDAPSFKLLAAPATHSSLNAAFGASHFIRENADASFVTAADTWPQTPGSPPSTAGRKKRVIDVSESESENEQVPRSCVNANTNGRKGIARVAKKFKTNTSHGIDTNKSGRAGFCPLPRPNAAAPSTPHGKTIPNPKTPEAPKPSHFGSDSESPGSPSVRAVSKATKTHGASLRTHQRSKGDSSSKRLNASGRPARGAALQAQEDIKRHAKHDISMMLDLDLEQGVRDLSVTPAPAVSSNTSPPPVVEAPRARRQDTTKRAVHTRAKLSNKANKKDRNDTHTRGNRHQSRNTDNDSDDDFNPAKPDVSRFAVVNGCIVDRHGQAQSQ